MKKVKIKKIKDPDTSVPINSGQHRIEAIKAEITSYTFTEESYEIEVFDMWEDEPHKTTRIQIS